MPAAPDIQGATRSRTPCHGETEQPQQDTVALAVTPTTVAILPHLGRPVATPVSAVI